MNIVAHRYWKNTYLKDTEMELERTEYEKLLAKRVYLSSDLDIFLKRCVVLDETTVHNCFKFCLEWAFSFFQTFSDTTWVWMYLLDRIALAKIYFWVRVTCATIEFLCERWTKSFRLVDSLVMDFLIWTLYYVTRKFLDCMQLYMMLLEEFDHIHHSLARDLATVIWL